MPFNADYQPAGTGHGASGHWTSPTTGIVYDVSTNWLGQGGVPPEENDAYSAEIRAENEAGGPNSGFDSLQKEMEKADPAKGLGMVPLQVNGDAPGASLNTAPSDATRLQITDLLAQLNQQAATGSGSWEGALKAATDQSKATASALGQSQANTGGDYSSSLRNIGNAQAGAEQRAVGQGNILREQSKLDATDTMADLTGSMGTTDIEQANAAARAKQQVGATNLSLVDQAEKNAKGVKQGISSAIPFSDGGHVPGRAKVPGNDEANDTVPTMLSPGEVVLPRTIAHDPDAAAEFVRTLNASKQRGPGGVQHMAEGGETGIGYADPKDYGEGNIALSVALPTIGQAGGYNSLRKKAGAGAPSIENGGLLDQTNFDNTRATRELVQSMYGQQAAGNGPSIAPQLLRNSTDDAMAAGMQPRGGGTGNASVVSAATNAAQAGGGQATATKANEQSAGQKRAGSFATQGRAQELSMAEAQQQAGWANTMQNLGLDLASQAALRGMFAGAGQAFTAASGAHGGGGGGKGSDAFSLGANEGASGATGGGDDLASIGAAGLGGGAGGGADSTGGGDEGPESDFGDGFAFGGAVGLADGGDVESHEMHTLRMRARREGADWAQSDVPVESSEMATLRKQAAKSGAKWAQEKPDTRRRLEDFAKTLSAGVSGMVPRKMAGENYATNPGAQVVPGGDVPTWPDGTPLTPAELAAATQSPNVAPMRAPAPAPLKLGATVTPTGDVPLPPAGRLSFEGMRKGNAPAPSQDQDPRIDFGSHASLNEAAALGVKPRGSGPGVPPPTPDIPPPTGLPVAGGVRLPPSHALERGFASNKEQLANEQLTEAGMATAAADRTAALDEQKVIENAARDERETRERTRMATAEAMTRWTAAQEEMSKVDGSIDPGRYWANKTTGQKVLGVIGLALGALGTGPDGINRAALMMNQAIDRDIDTQKAQFEARLKKAGAKVAAAQTFYGMARESGLDDIAATHAAKAAALQATAARAKAATAGVKSMEVQARGMALSAALDGAAIDKNTEAERWTVDAQQKNQHLRNEATAAGAKGAHPGAADRMKIADEVNTAALNIATEAEQLKALIEQNGTDENRFTGPGVAKQMDLLSDSLATTMAKMQDPSTGVRDPEMERWSANVFRRGYGQTSADGIAGLNNIINAAESRRQNALRVRGMR